MLITASNLDALFTGFNFDFKTGYMGEPQPLTDKIGGRVQSSTRDQRYPIVQAISGAMRQWTGGRVLNNVVVAGFTVENLLWEDSLAIQKVDIEDDQYGVYSDMLIPNLARHAKLLPDIQLAALINANTAIGFDGKTLFATDHPVDPSGATAGTNTNSLTTKPLNGTNLAIAQATMMSWKGPDNIPMGSRGNVLLVPPSMEYVAQTLAHAVFYPEIKNGVAAAFGSQSNMFQGQYEVVVSEHLTDSGDPATAVWYLVDARMKNLRPVFWQERQAPELSALVDPNNPIVFNYDQFQMGVRMRGAAAPGLWFKILKVSGA